MFFLYYGRREHLTLFVVAEVSWALYLDNSATDGDSHGLRAMCRAKFLHDVFDMNLDRVFGNEEALCNFPVSIALGGASEDLELARIGYHP